MSANIKYVLRNCAFWADNEPLEGQVSEIGVPMPKEVNQGARNAGMIKERQMAMGYELEALSFKMTGMDPTTHQLMTGKPGSETSYMATGALVDEDGTVHPAVLYIRGRMIEVGGVTWKPGEPTDGEFTVTPHYLKLEIDGSEVFEIDDYNYSVAGVSQTGDIRSALLLS